MKPLKLTFHLELVPDGHGADDYESDEGDAYILHALRGTEEVGYLKVNITDDTIWIRWIETVEEHGGGRWRNRPPLFNLRNLRKLGNYTKNDATLRLKLPAVTIIANGGNMKKNKRFKPFMVRCIATLTIDNFPPSLTEGKWYEVVGVQTSRTVPSVGEREYLITADNNGQPGHYPVKMFAPALRVWWVPQMPMKSFKVPVGNLVEAKKILNVLADYDLFQLEHNVKGDYANAGGLSYFDPCDLHDGPQGSWVDWENSDGDNIDQLEGDALEKEITWDELGLGEIHA